MRERYIPGKDFESKVRIFEALHSLLCGEEAIELDKVTMKVLCDRAGISTRAFYNHFVDKYEVLEWFMELSGADNFAQIGISKTPEEALGAYACVVDRYRELLRACYRSKHYGAIYAHLVNTIKEGLLEVVSGRCQDGIVPPLVAKQIKYFAVVAEAAAFDWIAEGPGGDRGSLPPCLSP